MNLKYLRFHLHLSLSVISWMAIWRLFVTDLPFNRFLQIYQMVIRWQTVVELPFGPLLSNSSADGNWAFLVVSCQMWIRYWTWSSKVQVWSISSSTGYTATALGVRSHCKLRDIPHLPDNKFEIDIVDRLPQISLATSLAKAASFTSVGDSACVVNSATTCLYAGQR